VEASLIAYLWPLLIVLGSAMLPGERLGWHHVAGALLGLAGAMLIVSDGGRFAFESRYAFGYAMAGLCALTWSSYSLLSRRFPGGADQRGDLVLPGGRHPLACLPLLLEETVWPQGASNGWPFSASA
jgi:drug/metabolite transporter (DMT)-like permease